MKFKGGLFLRGSGTALSWPYDISIVFKRPFISLYFMLSCGHHISYITYHVSIWLILQGRVIHPRSGPALSWPYDILIAFKNYFFLCILCCLLSSYIIYHISRITYMTYITRAVYSSVVWPSAVPIPQSRTWSALVDRSRFYLFFIPFLLYNIFSFGGSQQVLS